MAASLPRSTASYSSTLPPRARARGASTPCSRTGSSIALHRRKFAALAGSALLAPELTRGQAGWKGDKPITVYNPFAAGGGTDIHIRLLGETAGPKLGQQII